jgi:hypothetical protein
LHSIFRLGFLLVKKITRKFWSYFYENSEEANILNDVTVEIKLLWVVVDFVFAF